MNIFGKTLILLFLAAMLASCNSSQSTPTMSDAEIMQTAMATVSTAFAETPSPIPTNTPLLTVPPPTRTPPPPSPTSTPLAPTDTSIPLSERIVYYYNIDYHPQKPVPEGAVHVHPAGLLAPTYADEAYTSDTAADLRTALEIVLHDERNSWVGPEFEPEIVDVTFRSGHANVALQGEFTIGGPNPYAPLVGNRMLILLTVFANPSVQTAAISFNEDTIANLGISDRGDAKPADYVFTRAEIGTYLKEEAYMTPPPTPTLAPTSTPLVLIEPSHLPTLPPNAIDLQWITAYGLSGDQIPTRILQTRDGGFILVGNTLVGDHYSALLLKLRADGLIVWQKYLPQVAALHVLETSAGDFILAGDQHWTKLDSQGDILWQHTFERPSLPYHNGSIIRLVEESNGNIVVEAVSSRTVFNADGELVSITEATPPGSVIDRIDGNQFTDLVFVGYTADGGAIVGNYVVEDFGDVANIVSHVVISRFSEDGSLRWQKRYGGYFLASYDDFRAFETKSGDIIIAGTLHYFAENSSQGGDVWMLRLGRDGNIRWMKMYATKGDDAVTVIQELSNGDLLFAGHTGGAGTGAQDMWVLKTNAQGEIPNCGLMLDGDTGLFGNAPELYTLPLFEEGPRTSGDADALAYQLCSPSP